MTKKCKCDIQIYIYRSHVGAKNLRNDLGATPTGCKKDHSPKVDNKATELYNQLLPCCMATCASQLPAMVTFVSSRSNKNSLKKHTLPWPSLMYLKQNRQTNRRISSQITEKQYEDFLTSAQILPICDDSPTTSTASTSFTRCDVPKDDKAVLGAQNK